jgi:hypothetical protein
VLELDRSDADRVFDHGVVCVLGSLMTSRSVIQVNLAESRDADKGETGRTVRGQLWTKCQN